MRYSKAVSEGEVVSESNYHQPNKRSFGRGCGCSLTTENGAYRDTVVKMDNGDVLHFYHQNHIATEHTDGSVTVWNRGYETSTTKERLNRIVPSGYYIRQDDFVWYVEPPEGERYEFTNGVTLE
jgi:hypothetical protein